MACGTLSLLLLLRLLLLGLNWFNVFFVSSLVVGHCLQSVDNVGEAEPAIIIRVETPDPTINVFIFNLRRHIKIEQKRSKIISRDASMAELVNSSKDWQNGVVKLIDKVLLLLLNFFHWFDFSLQDLDDGKLNRVR